MGPTSAGFCFPNPSRPSRFSSLFPEHAIHNVEVDLAAIAAFDCAEPQDDAGLLHVDLQTPPGLGQGLMLGSGRAGFHRGRYLKGVGRTSLAGTWARPDHVYHGSGHLMPSAAVRELVVTRYLAARGLEHTIVPCEGLLLAPLDPRLAPFAARAFPPEAEVPPIDRALQAITVKPGDFARVSNLLWALDHPSPRAASSFFRNLKWALGVEADTPSGLASALAQVGSRSLERAAAWLSAGVYWGSFNNNATLDGRFLDLEVATIFGRPFLGALAPASAPPLERLGHELVVGLEALLQVRAFRSGVAHLLARLRALLELHTIAHPVEREFTAEFVDALGRELGPASPLVEKEALVARVSEIVSGALGRPGDPAIAALVLAEHDRVFRRDAPPAAAPLSRLPLRLARSEAARFVPYALPELGLDADFSIGARLNERLDAIADETSIDEVFAAVSALLAELAG